MGKRVKPPAKKGLMQKPKKGEAAPTVSEEEPGGKKFQVKKGPAAKKPPFGKKAAPKSKKPKPSY